MELTTHIKCPRGEKPFLELKNRRATVRDINTDEMVGYYNNVISVHLYTTIGLIYNWLAKFKEGSARVQSIYIHGSRWGKVLRAESDIKV